MRKIIAGRTYDTRTAQLVGTAEMGRAGEPSHAAEGLYRKRSGEWFIHGAGGPGSRYARRAGAAWVAGEQIVPLSPDEARAWADAHMSAAEVLAAFADAPQDGEGGVVRLDGPTFAAVCSAAEREGVTRGEVVRRAMAV